MKTLDLHGILHEEVDRIVEDFVLLEDLPLKIITGNSPSMKNLVASVLERHNLTSDPESYWNLGALVVRES